MAKKKLLIFAHYYVPDAASTGQILQDLADGMLQEFEVTVICVVPSYTGIVEDKYKKQKYYYENINGVNVVRVRVPEFAKTKKLSRVRNITAYFWGALGACIKVGKQDYIFTISQPPILGGILGVLGKLIKHAKMIYCIQDFNPEQIMAVHYSSNRIVLKMMLFLDNFSCKKSNLVITVGRDLVETLGRRFKNKNVPHHVMINNWIDEKAVYPLPTDDVRVISFKKKWGLEDKFVIMYSGNIGLYYDLENIIKVIEKFPIGTKTSEGKEVVFAFVGAGSILNSLIDYTKEKNMHNVVFIPYQPKEELIYSLNAADVHWCVNAKGIKGVSCPSKAYGIMAVGKPIIGVLEEGTEVRNIIEECDCGKCCEPCDYEAIASIILWYINNDNNGISQCMGKNGRIYLEKRLIKELSVSKYINAIKLLGDY